MGTYICSTHVILSAHAGIAFLHTWTPHASIMHEDCSVTHCSELPRIRRFLNQAAGADKETTLLQSLGRSPKPVEEAKRIRSVLDLKLSPPKENVPLQS